MTISHNIKADQKEKTTFMGEIRNTSGTQLIQTKTKHKILKHLNQETGDSHCPLNEDLCLQGTLD